MRGYFPVLFAVCASLLSGEQADPTPRAIVESYQAASRELEDSLHGASMEVEIAANLPRLHKRGRLQALRHISALGRITYDGFRWEGDTTIKTGVIARYLEAEVQAQKQPGPSLAVTPENYKFRYRADIQVDSRRIYVFQVTPRKKRTGLFKGELWIDAATHLAVRESGRMVKNPSIFLKKIEFVRKYEIRDGISIPREIQSVIDTRLVGKAELMVAYRNYSLAESTRRASLVEVNGQ